MKPYLKYIYEIMAILIGITLSFMVDEWREDRQNRMETIDALKMVKNDLLNDLENKDHMLKAIETMAQEYDITYNADLAKVSNDSILSLFFISGRVWPWAKYDNGYKSLITLDRKILSSDTLLQIINSYYSNKRPEVLHQRIRELGNRFTYNAYSKIKYAPVRFKIELKSDYEGTYYSPSYGNYYYLLSDSTSTTLNNFNNYLVELRSYMKSDEYLNHLLSKRNTERTLKNYINRRNRIRDDLIKLIEKEVTE
jgi:uncharacterized protein DUF6090